jgi:hypothetical protein
MNRNDTFGGLALVGFAAAYAFAAGNLSITSSLGIGPGLFPMVLAAILALLGTWIAVRGYAGAGGGEKNEEERGPIPYRGMAMIAAGPVLFGFLVVPLGVAPALLVAVFVSAMANPSISLLAALVSAVVLTVFCILLFRWGLDLPLDLFGPWLTSGE